MPFVRTKIDVRNDLPAINREIDRRAGQAVRIAAEQGAAVASGIASTRSKTGAMANIRPTPVRHTGEGWVATFASRVFYAWFQEEGTLGNRRKRLKRPPTDKRSHAPGTGVEPLRFMAAGRKAGRRAMLEHIRRGLPR